MNTKHYLRLLRTFALAALTAAAAACSDDNDENDGREPVTPDDGIPVTFTANINPGSDADPAGAPGTRTVLTPTDRDGFTVTWKGRNDNPDDYDKIFIRADNKQGTLIGGMGKVYVPTTSDVSSVLEPKNDQNKLTLTESGDWTFTAVYGTNTFTQNNEPIVIIGSWSQSASGNTEHIARRDFSVATATQMVAANSEMPAVINFKFEHKLSALQLRVTNQTGEELTIKEIRLFADGGQIAYQRDYDIATGKWKTTGEEKAAYLQLTASNFPALATGGTESQDLHMLFFPGYENETLTVTVITSRGEYSRTKRAPDGGFLAGKNYLTDITLRTDGLTAEEKWEEYITNKAELIAFRDKVNNGNTYDGKTVRLTADIDLANETWTPIGTDENKPFSGTFDGGGYHISSLNVNITTDYAGLFGYVNGGTVRNLRVRGNVTTSEKYAGGIVGSFSSSGIIENCIFNGEVQGGNYVGGITGTIENGLLAGCHMNGSVIADGMYAGGISGNNGGSITGCYSYAKVDAYVTTAGGIVGVNKSSSATVTRCYATGVIGSGGDCGGIAGTNEGTVEKCIALNSKISKTDGGLGYARTFGRIVGKKSNGTITDCAAFINMTLPDITNGEHGTDLSQEQCLTEATYTGHEFTTDNGWAFDNGATWTYLPWNKIFDSWNISETEYRIAVPDHLKAPVIP